MLSAHISWFMTTQTDSPVARSPRRLLTRGTNLTDATDSPPAQPKYKWPKDVMLPPCFPIIRAHAAPDAVTHSDEWTAYQRTHAATRQCAAHHTVKPLLREQSIMLLNGRPTRSKTEDKKVYSMFTTHSH